MQMPEFHAYQAEIRTHAKNDDFEKTIFIYKGDKQL
jgi:hypothetical protein